MKPLLLSAVVALAVTWLIGRIWGRADPETRSRMHKIDGTRARSMKASGAILIDVVTPQEFAAGHIPGAINIPVHELSGRLSEVAEGKELVVYCRSGARSARAAQIIAASGRHAYDLGPMRAF